SRPCHILSVAQKVAAVAWTLDTILSRMPDRSATQMGADSYESIDTLLVPHHPYPLFLQHAGTDLAHLIILGVPSNKLLQGFIHNTREKKPQQSDRKTTKEVSKAAPSYKTQQAPPRDTLCPRRGPYCSGHEASSPSLSNLIRSANDYSTNDLG